MNYSQTRQMTIFNLLAFAAHQAISAPPTVELTFQRLLSEAAGILVYYKTDLVDRDWRLLNIAGSGDFVWSVGEEGTNMYSRTLHSSEADIKFCLQWMEATETVPQKFFKGNIEAETLAEITRDEAAEALKSWLPAH